MDVGTLLLRCFVERIDSHQWQAFCLDLNLAAQAESKRDAMEKLRSMVSSYVEDALVGVDREHAEDLIPRRAPAELWVKYWALYARVRLRKFFGKAPKKREVYRCPIPLRPVHC